MKKYVLILLVGLLCCQLRGFAEGSENKKISAEVLIDKDTTKLYPANLFLIYFHIISAYPNILDISSDSFSSNFFSSSNITELGVSGVYL